MSLSVLERPYLFTPVCLRNSPDVALKTVSAFAGLTLALFRTSKIEFCFKRISETLACLILYHFIITIVKDFRDILSVLHLQWPHKTEHCRQGVCPESLRCVCLKVYPFDSTSVVVFSSGPFYLVNSKLDACSVYQSSGAVWKSRWPSWAVHPKEPYGFCGRKATLNHA